MTYEQIIKNLCETLMQLNKADSEYAAGWQRPEDANVAYNHIYKAVISLAGKEVMEQWDHLDAPDLTLCNRSDAPTATITIDDKGNVKEHIGLSYCRLTTNGEEFVAGIELKPGYEDCPHVQHTNYGSDLICDDIEKSDVYVSCYSMIQDNL